MNSTEALKLRRITKKEDIPVGTMYYTITHTGWGKNSVQYFKLFDENLALIECVQVAYTNTLTRLIHVSDDTDPFDFKPAQLVYHFSGEQIEHFHIITP